MQLGMIGLGRMGGNMAVRLANAGHDCLVYDSHPEAVEALVRRGIKGATDLPGYASMLGTPRVIWLMVPAGAVDTVIGSLMPLLTPTST